MVGGEGVRNLWQPGAGSRKIPNCKEKRSRAVVGPEDRDPVFPGIVLGVLVITPASLRPSGVRSSVGFTQRTYSPFGEQQVWVHALTPERPRTMVPPAQEFPPRGRAGPLHRTLGRAAMHLTQGRRQREVRG